MEKFAFLFCESGFVVDQVNNLSLSCGLFSSFLMNPIRFFSHSMLLMRMFVMLPGVFLRCVVVVQYIACGRRVQGYLPC